jgi:uncharacterized protein (DUF169 family)
MSEFQPQARLLATSLDLSLQPVAIAFCDLPPDQLSMFDGTVPAGCVFWQEAATRTFVTSAKDHALCSIGIHTHNMTDAPASQPDQLQASLQAMIGLDYVREEEIAAIAVAQRETKHAVYGPLAAFPMAPEVVLLFAHAQQGLILSEAVARVDGGAAPAMGRPACAVVPQALNSGRAAVSMGCCGARAYLDAMSDAIALWALPATKLDQYCEQIEILTGANKTLSVFHELRKKEVEAGARPTVQESLLQLG